MLRKWKSYVLKGLGMNMNLINLYMEKLYCDEKAESTIQKYRYELMRFARNIPDFDTITKEAVIAYKAEMKKSRKPSTINAAIAAINGFLRYIGKTDCIVKPVRVQRCNYRDESRMLRKKDYRMLLREAHKCADKTMYLAIETMCALGLRVSELHCITRQAAERGRAIIENKGKYRTMLLPKKLCEKVIAYCQKMGIESGQVFLSGNGKPLRRGTIWRKMKRFGRDAGIELRRVFPHNLRHLFAACFYQKTRDIEHLACFLGHVSMNTTRIYTMTSGEEHRRQLESLGLIS